MGMRSFSLCSVLAACLGVGLLGMPAFAAPGDSIGVHWSYYNQWNGGPGKNESHPVGVSDVVGLDGVAPQSNWNNLGAVWGGVDWLTPGTGLKDSNGSITTATATQGNIGPNSYWYAAGPATGVDNLLVGADGGGGAVDNEITGIPYSSYEIIAYLNDTQDGGIQMNAWLDGNLTAPNIANAAAGGVVYHGSAIGLTAQPVGVPFTQITNTTPGTFPVGNYVVFSGLTGAHQVLWITSPDSNAAIESFQIVDTSGVPEPASLSLLGTGALLLISRRRK